MGFKRIDCDCLCEVGFSLLIFFFQFVHVAAKHPDSHVVRMLAQKFIR